MTARAFLSQSIAVVAFCGTTAAAAATPVRSAAETLFDAGRSAMNEGRYDEACSKFEASHQLEPAVGTVFNLANCNDKRGRIAAALLQFKEAAMRMASGDPRAGVAAGRVEALEGRVPILTLRLSHLAPAGSTVVLDGATVPSQSLDVPAPIEPGDHLVVVRAGGRTDREYRVSATEGQHVELELEAGGDALAAGGGAAAKTSPDDAPPPRTRATPDPPVLGYVIGGVGAAALGTSLLTGILATSKEASLDGDCSKQGDRRLCNQAGVDAAKSGRTLAIVSDVSLGVGLLGVGIGTWLIFFHTPDGTAAGATPVPGGVRVDLKGAL